MKSNVMQMAGLTLAVAGALSIAGAQDGGGPGRGEGDPGFNREELRATYDADGDGTLN